MSDAVDTAFKTMIKACGVQNKVIHFISIQGNACFKGIYGHQLGNGGG